MRVGSSNDHPWLDESLFGQQDMAYTCCLSLRYHVEQMATLNLCELYHLLIHERSIFIDPNITYLNEVIRNQHNTLRVPDLGSISKVAIKDICNRPCRSIVGHRQIHMTKD